MHKLSTIFKRTLHIVAITVAILALALYLFTHFNLVGILVDSNIQEKLSEKFQTRVEVGEIEANWLNQVGMNHIVIYDQNDDTLFFARRAQVALEVMPLMQRKLIVNTVQLIDFHVYAKQDSIGAKPNYAFLIEALMPKDQTQQRKFLNDISLHALLLRQGTIQYDVLDQPESTNFGIPDPNHISTTDVSARLGIEVSHITGLSLSLRRLSLQEKSGLVLQELKGKGLLAGDSLLVQDFSASLSLSLLEEYPTSVSTRGSLSMIQDSLLITLNELNAEGDAWGNLDSKVHLQSTSSDVNYDIQFEPSQAKRELIERIVNEFSIHLPNEMNPWLTQVDAIAWDGLLQGRKTDFCFFDGHIASSGTLSSESKACITYDSASTTPVVVNLNSQIHSLYYQNHLYRNISVAGDYSDRRIKGDFECEDPLCNLQGQVELNINDTATLVQGKMLVRNLSPNALQWTDISHLEDLTFQGVARVDLSIPKSRHTTDLAANPYDLNLLPTGNARIDSLWIIGKEDEMEIGTIQMTNQKEQGTSVFAVISPIGHIVGTPTSLIGYIPPQQQLTHLLHFDGTLDQDLTFQMEWDSVKHQLTTELNLPAWIQGEDTCSFYLKGTGSTYEHNPMPIQLKTNIQFAYLTPKHQLGTDLRLILEPEPLRCELKPSNFLLDGKLFSSSDALLEQKEDGTFHLQNLRIHEGNQQIKIAGLIHQNQQMDMQIGFDNWQIGFLLDMLHKDYLDFGGYVTGDLQLSSDSLLMLRTNRLMVRDFSYLGTNLGLADIQGYYDFNNDHLNISADIENDLHRSSHADCEVLLLEPHNYIDLAVQLDSLPIDFISYWIGGAVQDLHGHASGDTRLFGSTDSFNLVGHPLLHNVNFTHELLGARFYITDTLNMESDDSMSHGFVGLNNVSIMDANGQKATLTLDIEHQHLKDMEYGLDLDIPESNNGFLVFDHPNQKEGDYYWGRLWATGRCQMHGTYSRHRISAQLAPAGRSIFNLSPNEENFTDNAYSFLTFRDKNKYLLDEEITTEDTHTRTLFNKNDEEEPIYVEADLLIHANERCQVYVQLDPLAEDRLICKGSGDLALHYDPHHDINMTGLYDISSGSYTVTMKGDVMTKAFQLQKDSRVTFPGSLREAELDLKAVYNIPSANLRDLDESFASLASLSRTTLPVDCKLNVMGQITVPQISFDLEVKNTSDDVQALVHNIIGDQEMLNREVFYLLLFSKFYTPEYASTSQRQTGSELTSFASSSLTSQLNNLLGHMSDNFTLGTNFRSDKGDFTDMEMDVSVSTRLLNDRLLMTGNLGYRDPANTVGTNTNNNTFIGDFDVEFLINTKGTVRAKAYSHSNERDYSINNALTTQGIGIILRKDFKSIKELLKRKQ